MRISLVVPVEVEVQGLAIGFIPSMYLCFSPARIQNEKSPLNIDASEGSIRCSLVMPTEFSVDGPSISRVLDSLGSRGCLGGGESLFSERG